MRDETRQIASVRVDGNYYDALDKYGNVLCTVTYAGKLINGPIVSGDTFSITVGQPGTTPYIYTINSYGIQIGSTPCGNYKEPEKEYNNFHCGDQYQSKSTIETPNYNNSTPSCEEELKRIHYIPPETSYNNRSFSRSFSIYRDNRPAVEKTWGAYFHDTETYHFLTDVYPPLHYLLFIYTVFISDLTKITIGIQIYLIISTILLRIIDELEIGIFTTILIILALYNIYTWFF